MDRGLVSVGTRLGLSRDYHPDGNGELGDPDSERGSHSTRRLLGHPRAV